MELIEQNNNYKYFLFLKSAFAKKDVLPVIQWLKARNEEVKVNIKKIAFSSLNSWHVDDKMGAIRHESGKFFSIEGIHIKTNWGEISEWEQPIINQPEVGYLGIITKEFDGILHFLMQAKIEPGNVNYVQLSPTLQATRSNYTQIHKGKKPLYLDYFKNAKPEEILLDQLQSEQGARFLKKRNRNIIIKVDEEIPVYDNFVWLTLAQIKELMRYDNLINMDTRTVISGITYGTYDDGVVNFFDFLGHNNKKNDFSSLVLKSSLVSKNSIHSIDSIISILTHIKSNFDLDVYKKPLNKLDKWKFKDREISHVDNKFFKVIAVDVEIGNREVVKWSQPMVEPAQEGLCAFVCKEINGILHFIVQAKLECGNHDIIELAPTVQCLTGNYRNTKTGELPFLEYVLHAKKKQIVFDTLQSEEGGRFFREQNRNMIVFAGNEILNQLPENYFWMTLNQLYIFLKFNNFLNIQARSLISAITFID